jgi:hypothetical protein
MPQPEFRSGRPGATDDSAPAQSDSAPAQSDSAAAQSESAPAQSESARAAVEHCRVWLNWAAEQIDASLASDNVASGQLLAALAGLLGRSQRSDTAPAPANDAVSGKMSAVIVAVQSHDRVMQGLTHVAQSLRALHWQLGKVQRAEFADSEESWRMLRENQFHAFSMAEERELFARLVACEHESTLEIAANRADSAELFTTLHGINEP